MIQPSKSVEEAADAPAPPLGASVEQLVLEAIRGIRYGSVEITIHDSRVVQIERSEKLRVAGEAKPGTR